MRVIIKVEMFHELGYSRGGDLMNRQEHLDYSKHFKGKIQLICEICKLFLLENSHYTVMCICTCVHVLCGCVHRDWCGGWMGS